MANASNNRIYAGVLAVLLAGSTLFGAFINKAEAQSYYSYTPGTQEEQIAYLQGVIAQLITLLNARGNTSYQYNTGFNGNVRGAQSNRDGRADVNVGTSFLRRDSDDIYFNGRIDLEREDYAYVWFEYDDNDDDFDEATSRKRITRDGSFSAHIDADDLRSGRWYYYRAAAEDPDGDRDYGVVRALYVGSSGGGSSNNDDEPTVTTENADEVDENSAELNGRVDMNDFRNGVVFFVYGEDESQIEDVDRDYDSYSDVDEDGDDLQKIRVDTDLDGDERYSEDIGGLDRDTWYYYQICVEYEDEDDDETLECGGVEDFETDRNGSSSRNDEPDVRTLSARDVDDDSAELNGEVDMNDFEDGRVFFVYGEDENQIEDIEDDYDTYSEVDEDGDDLQKILISNNFDGSGDAYANVYGLDDNTRHYFQICVEYEDEDNDDVILCGGVEDFETDN